MIEVAEVESRTVTLAAGWEVRRLNSREIMSSDRRETRAAPARVSARRLAIGATRLVGFLDAWGAWYRAKTVDDDIPHDDAPPVECLRPIVGHHVLVVPQPGGAFAYSLVGQGLRQLGWPESLCGTLSVENAALRSVTESHYREAMEEREPSLYEIKVSHGDGATVYHRLALPFGDSEVVRFLLLGISVVAAPTRGLRALTASH
jgi:hypothetical protein